MKLETIHNIIIQLHTLGIDYRVNNLCKFFFPCVHNYRFRVELESFRMEIVMNFMKELKMTQTSVIQVQIVKKKK